MGEKRTLEGDWVMGGSRRRDGKEGIEKNRRKVKENRNGKDGSIY